MKKKFIQKSQSSTKYLILFVFKKDEKLRLCVDYRKLNEIIIKNRYSLSNINELQNKLSKAKYFTKFNFKRVYNLIRMKTKKKWKTIFRTRYEHYEYTMISFELINASTICQEIINNALREHLNVFVITYLNDILIYFKTLSKHKQHVRKVLQCLKQRRLLFKLEKCEFHRFDVEFFEFVMRIQEIRMNSIKLKAIKNWSQSINVKKVQIFLRFVNYNRKFIKDYFKKIIPLINLMIKDKL